MFVLLSYSKMLMLLKGKQSLPLTQSSDDHVALYRGGSGDALLVWLSNHWIMETLINLTSGLKTKLVSVLFHSFVFSLKSNKIS